MIYSKSDQGSSHGPHRDQNILAQPIGPCCVVLIDKVSYGWCCPTSLKGVRWNMFSCILTGVIIPSGWCFCLCGLGWCHHDIWCISLKQSSPWASNTSIIEGCFVFATNRPRARKCSSPWEVESYASHQEMTMLKAMLCKETAWFPPSMFGATFNVWGNVWKWW